MEETTEENKILPLTQVNRMDRRVVPCTELLFRRKWWLKDRTAEFAPLKTPDGQ